MRKIISNAGKVAFNPWFIIWASISGIAGFFWYVHDRIAQYPPILSGLYFAASLIFLLSGIVYSLKVRSENVALKNIASTFNEINHIYRDALKNVWLFMDSGLLTIMGG